MLKKDKQTKNGQGKSRAQSLVEFAITLPMLLLLFSGLVEFGFSLNYYLSLLDATRESARRFSNFDPFDPITGATNMVFYEQAAQEAYANLDPTVRPGGAGYQGRRIVLDPATDNILVTVFSWSDYGGVERFPESGTYTLFPNATNTSKFTNDMIADRFETFANSPNAGLLLVEVHFNYRQVLALPWLEPFVPNPLLMRAYTIMPLGAAEPVEATATP